MLKISLQYMTIAKMDQTCVTTCHLCVDISTKTQNYEEKLL